MTWRMSGIKMARAILSLSNIGIHFSTFEKSHEQIIIIKNILNAVAKEGQGVFIE